MSEKNQYLEIHRRSVQRLGANEGEYIAQYLVGFTGLKCFLLECLDEMDLEQIVRYLAQAYVLCPAKSTLRRRIFLKWMLALVLCYDQPHQLHSKLETIRLKRHAVGRDPQARLERDVLGNLLEYLGDSITKRYRLRRCTPEEMLIYALVMKTPELNLFFHDKKQLLAKLRDGDAETLLLMGHTKIATLEKAAYMKTLVNAHLGTLLRCLQAVGSNDTSRVLLQRCWITGFEADFPAHLFTGELLLTQAIEDRREPLKPETLAYCFRTFALKNEVLNRLGRRFIQGQAAQQSNLELTRILVTGCDLKEDAEFIRYYLDYLCTHTHHITPADEEVLRYLLGSDREQRCMSKYLLSCGGGGEDPLDSYPVRCDKDYIDGLLGRASANPGAHPLDVLWLNHAWLIRLPVLDNLGEKGTALPVQFTFTAFREVSMPTQIYYLGEDNYYLLPEQPVHLIVLDGSNAILRLPATQGAMIGTGVSMQSPLIDSTAGRKVQNVYLRLDFSGELRDFALGSRIGGEILWFQLIQNVIKKSGGLSKETIVLLATALSMTEHLFTDWQMLLYLNRLLPIAPETEVQEELLDMISSISPSYQVLPEQASSLTLEQLELSMDITQYLQSVSEDHGDRLARALLLRVREQGDVYLAAAVELCGRLIERGSVFESACIEYLAMHFQSWMRRPQMQGAVINKLFASSKISYEIKLMYKLAHRTIDTEFIIALASYYRSEGGQTNDLMLDIAKLLCHGPFPCTPSDEICDLMRQAQAKLPEYQPLRDMLQRL